MCKSWLFRILIFGGRCILGYGFPRLLIAFGVPLDDWIEYLPSWFNYEIVFWLFVVIIGGFIFSLTYLVPYLISGGKRSREQETIESLKEQQEPKLEVTFEQGKKPYLEHFRRMSPITNRDGQLYYNRIRIKNTCSEIIKNVNVKLIKIKDCPDDFSAERCYLEFRHHPGDKAIDIQPYDDEFVDIIGYFEPFNKDIEKKEMYMLIAGGMIKLYIPQKKCDITIQINSDNGGKPIPKNIKFTPRKNVKLCMEVLD